MSTDKPLIQKMSVVIKWWTTKTALFDGSHRLHPPHKENSNTITLAYANKFRFKHSATTKSKLIRHTIAACIPLALTRGFEVSWNNFITRGVQIFQKWRSHFKFLGFRKATRIQQQYRAPQNIVTVQNLVPRATWRPVCAPLVRTTVITSAFYSTPTPFESRPPPAIFNYVYAGYDNPRKLRKSAELRLFEVSVLSLSRLFVRFFSHPGRITCLQIHLP